MRIASSCIGLLITGLTGVAHASDFCVSTTPGFTTALATAAASAEDDTIRITTAPINLSASLDVEVFGSLAIRGGYPTGCSGFGSNSAISEINGQQSIRLTLRDQDLTLSRLRFNGITSTEIRDVNFDSNVTTGLILVQRVSVDGGNTGLRIFSTHHDVRVENSLFTGSTSNSGGAYNGAGFTLDRFSDEIAPITVELINNTAVGNRYGFSVIGVGQSSLVPLLVNNVAFDNRAADLRLENPVLLQNNLWVSESFIGSGMPAPGSAQNLHVNAQISASYKPIVPSSPLINSGSNTPPGGLPTTDHDGGLRQIGTLVDRGAFETSVNDITTFTVTNANNTGSGSLRQAITDANQSSDASEIEFDISGNCPRVIGLTSTLPAVTTPTRILGYSQAGSARNEAAYAFDGTLCIALNGAGSIASGLRFQTGTGETMSVEGIAFYGFTSEAVLISGTGSGNVLGNAFGTGAAGLAAPGFDDAAIRVQNAPASLIGGGDVASRNVISRAAQVGVSLEASTGGREVIGNLIGFNLAGTGASANGIGIHVDNSNGDTINNNFVGFSATHGILVTGTTTPPYDMRIKSNRLGVSAVFGAAGNGGNGARFEAGSLINFNNNSVKYNGTDGVVVLADARRISIGGNYYFQNALQAIDLSPNGVNPIDLDVGATGANDQQNYPTLTDASGSATSGTATGNLQSANDTYVIQFFRTASCDANGYGEADLYIGETVVTISNAGPSSNGSAAFVAALHSDNVSLLTGVITAIATDSQGNASEVSACTPFLPGPLIFANGFE